MKTSDLTELVAAVDLGSNSFHMIVGRLDNGHLTIVDKMRERVRLGAGLDSQERLTTKARDRALDCLHRFGERVRGMPLGRVRAVGTNTLRKMRESENFLYEARLALGHPVEVIAGQEEARLIYLGVLQSLPERDQQRLVIDIGGGSTECIVGYNEQIKLANSLYMGCVAYSLQFFNDQRLTARAFEQAQLAVRLELQPIVRRYKKRGWDLAVGCSGTIHAIRKIVQANGWSPPGRITRDGLKRVKRALIAAGHIDDLELAGLHEDRRPVIAGGVSILHALFEAFELSEMTPSPGALREGALYDLVGRIQQEDVRDRTISAVQTRHDVDEGQAGRVKGVAIDLWKQIGGDWRIDSPMCRRLLTWAADLHEIGLSISYTGYHKHSAYVVQNADLAGFSTTTQAVLAAIIRGHRRRLKPSTFDALGRDGAQTRKLAVTFRLAFALCRSRSDDEIPAIDARINRKGRLVLRLPEDWADAHPMSMVDLSNHAAMCAKLDIVVDIKTRAA